MLVEACLRLSGHGHPPQFFLPLDDREAYATNQKFGWRFFPPVIARPPVPSVVASPKPLGTYRIFVLGSSAAMGEPEPAFSFGRILEVMLGARYPDTRFEVVNTAMTAINSHVLLPIARDCAAMEPDLFIIYEGNNEVVGPYGPGTVLSAFSTSSLAIRSGIWLRSTRTGQFIRDGIQWLARGDESIREWRGMETFLGRLVSADDPRMEHVYEHFRRNLTDIADIARGTGAEVILCTVATNLKDNAPFASIHREDLSAADRARWERAYEEGISRGRAGRHDGAIESYLEAARIDDRFAELHFRLGRSSWALEKFHEARRHFLLARDLDALRFRTDSRLNNVIREVAAAGNAQGAHLVDAERAFETSEWTIAEVPGDELFYEHVHMNYEGNYLLAATIYRALTEILPAGMRRGAAVPPEPPSPARCAEALALTGWNRHRIATQITAIRKRPPFTHQIDHDVNFARWQESVGRLESSHNTPEALRAADQAHRRAVERAPDDLLLGANRATLLHALGDYEGAAEQWRTLLRVLPDIAPWHEELGHALLYQQKEAEAIAEYREALRIWPGRALDHSNIGVALERQEKPADAIREFREALRLSPGNVMAHLNLGLLLGKQGNRHEAIEHFKEAVRDTPDHVGARITLGDALAAEGELEEAITQYREALRYNSRSAQAYTQLGLVLAEQKGMPEEAARHLGRALEIEPDRYDARLGLAILYHDLRKYAECEAQLRETTHRHPGQAEPHQLLARLYQETGRPDDAQRELDLWREITRGLP